MSDPRVLNQIFQDSELTKALAGFFEDQAASERKTSAELMGAEIPRPETARAHACYAKAYEEAMGRLRAYVKQV